MKTDIIQTLLRGDEEAILGLGESDICAVVDWRDGAEEIFTAIAEFLPDGFLAAIPSEDGLMTISASGGPTLEVNVPLNKQEPFIDSINRILSPDYEIRQFRPCDGDGYSLLVRPASWWSQFDEKHPEIAEKYFLSTKRLAAYWSKNYFARLLSKP
jgi:hypothetical protein